MVYGLPTMSASGFRRLRRRIPKIIMASPFFLQKRFRSFDGAWRTIQGYEVLHIRKIAAEPQREPELLDSVALPVDVLEEPPETPSSQRR